MAAPYHSETTSLAQNIGRAVQRFLPSAFRLSRGRRKPAVTALAALLVIYFLSVSWKSQHALESKRLEHFMNHDADVQRWMTENSFDWSKVKFRHPPAAEFAPLPPSWASRLPRIQHHFWRESRTAAETREARRNDVRRVFKKNWASYKRFAWMQDALLPIAGGGKDQFSGWAATLVDSLDTLWIMGLKEEFDEAVKAVATIDFGKTNSPMVNMFETNIRYLGGLLAAYDLSGRSILLQKATELGDLLYAGFNTEDRMPVDFINFELAKTGDGLEVEGTVVSASPGTISMEFTRLSQLTGDLKYYNAITKVMDIFHDGQNATNLPGMWPMMVSMRTKDVTTGSTFTLAGCADSLYEYLPKMVALLGGGARKYATMSKAFLETANKYLLFRPMVPDEADILISGQVNAYGEGRVFLDAESEHLACFLGGVYAVGGRLLKRSDFVDVGAKLALGCAYVYRSFPTGLGPERFNMAPCQSRQQCSWNESEFQEAARQRPEYRATLPKGFTTAKDARYILRPEAIESLFVLWRVTGRSEFQEAAWDMWQAVSNGTETEYANAAVRDVTTTTRPLELEDYMEVSIMTANVCPQHADTCCRVSGWRRQ
jgi:mannosyl-oligosaccharide alpha-1,2-mannosidase